MQQGKGTVRRLCASPGVDCDSPVRCSCVPRGDPAGGPVGTPTFAAAAGNHAALKELVSALSTAKLRSPVVAR